jgi:NADPH:quinone reductase-like Zn-dependent oxidoreductase
MEEMPIPAPEMGEVLIHVEAASINPTDVAYRSGYMAPYIPLTFPATLGLDVAGTVEAVGSGVTNLKVEDPVYTRTDLTRLGGYAEYAVVAAAEVVCKPDQLDYVEAACLPHAAVTAWRSLVDAGSLKAGQTVLIHGAAGGLGTVAVQLAKSLGAYVIGTASTGNLEYLRQLGVDEAFDYTASGFEHKYKNIDLVLDTVGGDTLARSYQVVRPGGTLLSVMENPSPEKMTEYGIKGTLVGGYPPVGPVLEEMNKLVEAGKMKPFVRTTLPMDDIVRAHEMIETRHGHGKIILQY